MNKIKKCIICRSNAYLYFNYKDIFGKNVNIYKCINCGHGFHKEKYSENQYKNIYAKDYAKSYIGSKIDKAFNLRLKQYRQDTHNLLRIIKNKKLSVLDYGCSTGNYLSTMPNGWSKHGFEINKTEIEYIKKNKKNIKIYEDVSKINKKFDIITMRGVIEHIQDHKNLLYFLKNRIKKNGFLYISATPDFSSPAATLYQNYWNQTICPQHIHQFSTSSLSLMLAKSGLVMLDMQHRYYETPYASWKLDKNIFLKNFELIKKGQKPKNTSHAFPGTMISALFQKVK